MKMDCFAAKVCLRDQTKILIGGLCISGVVPELLRRCRKLEDGTLPVNTVVGIDRAMAQMLDTLQMKGFSPQERRLHRRRRPHDLQKPDGGQAV